MTTLDTGRFTPPPTAVRAVGVSAARSPRRPSARAERALRRAAALTVVVLFLVVVTGGLVRLTGSGLGCPTWPRCAGHRFASGTDVHGLIEFGNRVLSAVVFLVGIVALAVAALRARRPDVRLLIAVLVAGYLGEVVLGGLAVLTRLSPVVVAAHFLLALGLLWAALVLQRRVRYGRGAPTAASPPPVLWVSRAVAALSAAVLTVGTVVTGSGPHSGGRVDNRLPLPRGAVTHLHADLAFLLIGATAVLVVLLRSTGAPAGAQRRAGWLVALLVGQAAIGGVQYALRLPAGLVVVHIAGAAAVWATAVSLHLHLFHRPARDEPRGSAAGHLAADRTAGRAADRAAGPARGGARSPRRHPAAPAAAQPTA